MRWFDRRPVMVRRSDYLEIIRPHTLTFEGWCAVAVVAAGVAWVAVEWIF